MVVTFLSCTWETAIWQERTALPSTCTVQAPHRPEPHPNFVPVSFRCSRNTHNSGVSGSAVTLTALSLTVKAIVMLSSRSLANSLCGAAGAIACQAVMVSLKPAVLPGGPPLCPVVSHYRPPASTLALPGMGVSPRDILGASFAGSAKCASSYGAGTGGTAVRNQEYAPRAGAPDGTSGIAAPACGTDGTGGGSGGARSRGSFCRLHNPRAGRCTWPRCCRLCRQQRFDGILCRCG